MIACLGDDGRDPSERGQLLVHQRQESTPQQCL